MATYTKSTANNHALFSDQLIGKTLKEVISDNHKTIFSIAETEKYAHVTYFFGGGKEEPFPQETRILIPSVHVSSYIQVPCMSAPEITAAVISSLKINPHDFYLINYANADMVGHSGDFNATVKAIECLDIQLRKLYDMVVIKMNGTLYITSDHGKAEALFDTSTHQPKTSHSTNLVPFIMVERMLKGQDHQLHLHGLKDIAPFILKNMGLPIPDVME
jgi:2,3-bisphosphoglycerate-independent phosphoglycerate mutase